MVFSHLRALALGSLVAGFAVSCAPVRFKSRVDSNFRPSPERDQPVLIYSENNFVNPMKITLEQGGDDAPYMVLASGTPYDFNRRGGRDTPDAVTPAQDGSSAIEPQSDSECGLSCSVKNLYFNVASFFSEDAGGTVQ